MPVPAPTELLVFLKAPRAGRVKTRLAKDLGKTRALAAYRLLVETLMNNLRDTLPATLCFTPPESESEIITWLGADHRYEAQRNGDLGARLAHAISRAFGRGAGRVIVLGADCPDVVPDDLHRADELLETSDVVIGPARDGGYWLVGLNRAVPELFQDIEWSTQHVCAQTTERAAALGLQVETLRTLTDVDTLVEWRAFCESRGIPVE